MSAIVLYGLTILLFGLIFVFIRQFLVAFAVRRTSRLRLQYVQQARIGLRFGRYLARFKFVHTHIADMLESTGSKMTVPGMAVLTCLLLAGGFVAGALFFQSLKGILALTFMIASIPYLFLRMRLLSFRLKTRLEFLPAVEVFYQYYLIYGLKNVKYALKMCLDENRIQYPMKPVFEMLNRNLMTSRGVEQSLRVLNLTLGHVWGDYFVNILRVALTEGNPIDENLRDLITDMRKAQRYDQAERNRLLEIRIANFTPLLFLALFLGINFQLNADSAYAYYVLEPDGRGMLLDALLLIFVSFLMGVYLSMKRM